MLHMQHKKCNPTPSRLPPCLIQGCATLMWGPTSCQGSCDHPRGHHSAGAGTVVGAACWREEHSWDLSTKHLPMKNEPARKAKSNFNVLPQAILPFWGRFWGRSLATLMWVLYQMALRSVVGCQALMQTSLYHSSIHGKDKSENISKILKL